MNQDPSMWQGGKVGFSTSSYVSVYVGSPIRFPGVLSRSKVDGFVSSTQDVNLRQLWQGGTTNLVSPGSSPLES